MKHTVIKKERLSQKVSSIQPSGIRRFFDLASKMDNIISLGVGEPDFVTPWNVREASISSLERGLPLIQQTLAYQNFDRRSRFIWNSGIAFTITRKKKFL